jgi:hypothetical protein
MTMRGSAPTSFIFSRRSPICKHVVGRARYFPLSSNVRPDLANIRADTLQGVAVWRLRRSRRSPLRPTVRSDHKRAAWRCDRNSSPSISASRSRHTSIDRQVVTDPAMETWYHPSIA